MCKVLVIARIFLSLSKYFHSRYFIIKTVVPLPPLKHFNGNEVKLPKSKAP